MGGVLKIRKINVNSQIEAQAGIGETLWVSAQMKSHSVCKTHGINASALEMLCSLISSHVLKCLWSQQEGHLIVEKNIIQSTCVMTTSTISVFFRNQRIQGHK